MKWEYRINTLQGALGMSEYAARDPLLTTQG